MFGIKNTKAFSVFMVLALVMSVFAGAGGVAAFSTLDSVSDVDSSGTQTIAIAPDSGGSPAAGDVVRITTTGASPDLDYSNATISHDGAGSVTNNSATALDFTYTLDSTDVTEGTPVTFTVEGVESTASTQDTVEIDYTDDGTINGGTTFSAVDTTSATTYEVSGSVALDDGTSVSAGTVEILDSSDNVVNSASVNSDGTYSVQVADGDYSVSHTASGYESGDYSITVNGAAETQDITVSELQDVSGTVTDADGNAVSDGLVTVTDSNGVEVGSNLISSDGSYSFQLSDGDYTLEASSDGYTTVSQDVTVSGATTQDITLEATSEYSFSVVDDGTSVSEFDFELYDADGNQVGDTVTKTDGSAVSVTQLVVGDEYTAQVTVDETDADGNTVSVTYEKTFTAEAPADGNNVVSESLDVSTMDEASDGYFGGGIGGVSGDNTQMILVGGLIVLILAGAGLILRD